MKLLLIVLVMAIAGILSWRTYHPNQTKISNPIAAYLPCASNSSGKKIVVSESRRHMWACEGHISTTDYPVVTGYSGYAETVTPLGTYTISNKLQGIPLKGSDMLGSWNVFVKYWMPFLHNQYGDYGFHDATWRSPSEFGNVPDSSRQASHGCVEMPSDGMKWVYSWAPTGTKVSIIA